TDVQEHYRVVFKTALAEQFLAPARRTRRERVGVNRVVEKFDPLKWELQTQVRAAADVAAHGYHPLAARTGRPAVERERQVALPTAHVRAVLPSLRLVVGVVDGTDDGHAGQPPGHATDDVRRPEVRVQEVCVVGAQPTAQARYACGQVAQAAAAAAFDRHAQPAYRLGPVVGPREDRDHGAAEACGVEVLQVRV